MMCSMSGICFYVKYFVLEPISEISLTLSFLWAPLYYYSFPSYFFLFQMELHFSFRNLITSHSICWVLCFYDWFYFSGATILCLHRLLAYLELALLRLCFYSCWLYSRSSVFSCEWICITVGWRRDVGNDVGGITIGMKGGGLVMKSIVSHHRYFFFILESYYFWIICFQLEIRYLIRDLVSGIEIGMKKWLTESDVFTRLQFLSLGCYH